MGKQQKARSITDEEFKLALKQMLDDVISAKHHQKLYLDLVHSVKDNERVMNETRAFWWLTLNAHKETCLFRLCRVFEQETNALQLSSFLAAIKHNLHLFDLEKFKNRIGFDENEDELPSHPHQPAIDEVDKDILFASNDNPLVKKLTILRNNVYAHRNFDGVISETDWHQAIAITMGDLGTLIDESIKILNKYNLIFQSTTNSSSLVGEDDYKVLLKLLSKGFKS